MKISPSTCVALHLTWANNQCPTFLKWYLWETNKTHIYYDSEIGIVFISIITLTIILAVIIIKLQNTFFSLFLSNIIYVRSVSWQPDAVIIPNVLSSGI